MFFSKFVLMAKATWRHDTQHNDIQHNNTQHIDKENVTLSIMAVLFC